MTHTTCELIWIQSFLCEMSVISIKSMMMYFDNQATMYIVNNLVFHEQMKHIEVDCHFIKGMVMTQRTITLFITSSCQLRDILNKTLSRKSFSILCSKPGMIDIYAPV